MKNQTPLEKACNEILGETYQTYYDILSNLLLLNSNLIKKDDSRLTAKITLALFDDEIVDKPHVICEFINQSEMERDAKSTDIVHAKDLLDVDPELINTIKIIDALKRLPDPNYTEIMRKVKIHNELRMYREAPGIPFRSRI
ncbi:MAG: hypothetical protein FK734_19640 [Asgard group archaeon]|nr:hypothetical protein [Asgard group archaeon]